MIENSKSNKEFLEICKHLINHYNYIIKDVFGPQIDVCTGIKIEKEGIEYFGNLKLIDGNIKSQIEQTQSSMEGEQLSITLEPSTNHHSMKHMMLFMTQSREINIDFCLVFLTSCPDYMYSYFENKHPCTHSLDKSIKKNNLLYCFQNELTESIIGLAQIINSKNRESNENLLQKYEESKQSLLSAALHGISNAAIIDYCASTIGSDDNSLIYFDKGELSKVISLLQDISYMELEKKRLMGGCIFVNDYLSLKESNAGLNYCDLKPSPIDINEIYMIRKLLSISDGKLVFLVLEKMILKGILYTESPAKCVIPFGIKMIGELHGTPILVIFRGKGQLSFYFGDQKLFEMVNGKYKLRSEIFLQDVLKSMIAEIRISHEEEVSLVEDKVSVLINLIERCRDYTEGALMVIGNTKKYLKTLNNAINIQPLEIEDPKGIMLTERLSGIDGAILIDTDLKVLAFGAILPFLEKGYMDVKHGARHNAALSFTKGKSDIFAVVLSQDGPISVVYDGKYLWRSD
jgi:DNA integrity scanning protein DisA with diadenylate cyclase activity